MKNYEENLFTVIVMCYNNFEFIYQCLDSVLQQDYQSIELIVVDDCSVSFRQNEFVEYIESHKNENIAYYTVYQNEENLGTVKSLNNAIKKCHGEYIKDIACDDAFYSSNVLSEVVRIFNNNDILVFTSDVMKCDEHLNDISLYSNKKQKYLAGLTSEKTFQFLCLHNWIIAGGMYFRLDFFKEYGLFDENYRLLEDWPQWLNASLKGCCFPYYPLITYRYRINGGVSSGVNLQYLQDKQNVFKDIVKVNAERIGLIYYIGSFILLKLTNSIFVRRLHGLLNIRRYLQ